MQRAEDFLYDEAIDVVVLGEGEETFTELLDCASRDEWLGVAGLAFLDGDGAVHRTAARPRSTELDQLPVRARRDRAARRRRPAALQAVAYETSRGCPYRCSFCEWGTGAIGTKMYQFSLARIRSDLERLVGGGIKDIWLCDSNFGALREDLAKAEIVVELHQRARAAADLRDLVVEESQRARAGHRATAAPPRPAVALSSRAPDADPAARSS